jgi:hypothetical protein
LDIPNSIAFFANMVKFFIMPEKVNGNKFSGKSNIASLNSNHSPIDSKSAVQLNSSEQKLATLQKMAVNSPYSQRFTQLKSLANKTTPSHHPVSQLSKDSHSLPDNVKQGVESLSGISMDDVKVHYNSAKPAQLNAHAYAQGTDIHLASGQEKHLPHEAWHVVQQKQGRVQPTTMMKAKVPINDDQVLEKEADVMGARALQMKPFSLSDYSAGKSVQKKGIVQKVDEPTKAPKSALEAQWDAHLNTKGEGEGEGEGEGKNTNLFVADDPALGYIESTRTAFLSAVEDFKQKSPADLTKLSLNVEKFGLFVFDKVDKASKDPLLSEALSTSIALLPGIGAALGALKNSIEYYQTCIKTYNITELLTLKDSSDESPFTIQEIELINQYKTDLDKSIKNIKVDFILHFTTALLAVSAPPVALAFKGLHLIINGFQGAIGGYKSYLDDRERKRAERIGETDVEELKSNKIVEKSEKVNFKVAVKNLLSLQRLENQVPQDADQIIIAQDNLDKNLREINDLRLVYAGSNSLITKENLETFLIVEKEVIKKIAKEVSEEKSFMHRLFPRFNPSKKEQLTKEMKFKGILKFDHVLLGNILDLSPEMQDYFYDKTQIAIKVACKRKHISANERLDKIKELLLTKQDDAVIKSYMLDKYKGQEVYDDFNEDGLKFTKSVNKFMSQTK